MIEPILKNDEAIAGTPKTLRAFSMPMTCAPSETSRMKGNMICASSTVSCNFSGSCLNPVTVIESSTGARSMPPTAMIEIPTMSSEPTLFASRQAAGSPSVAIFLEKVVMNAVESAPSAKRSRSRFGVLNAIVKASIERPAPKSVPKTSSRTSPSTRVHITARPTSPAALVLSAIPGRMAWRRAGVGVSHARLCGGGP